MSRQHLDRWQWLVLAGALCGLAGCGDDEGNGDELAEPSCRDEVTNGAATAAAPPAAPARSARPAPPTGTAPPPCA